jgi:hypothetical protein
VFFVTSTGQGHVPRPGISRILRSLNEEQFVAWAAENEGYRRLGLGSGEGRIFRTFEDAAQGGFHWGLFMLLPESILSN